MNILLDTHIYLWWLTDDMLLSKKARELIQEAQTVYISSISIWEVIIKTQLGKLTASIPELIRAVETEGFVNLPFTSAHAESISFMNTHHRDPFDRALIAQAISEPAHLITVDKKLLPYSENIMMV